MTTDEEVLAYIGGGGKSDEDLAQRFPGFDMARLVRAQLVGTVFEASTDTEAHALDATVAALRYVLTSRGGEALGMSSGASRA